MTKRLALPVDDRWRTFAYHVPFCHLLDRIYVRLEFPLVCHFSGLIPDAPPYCGFCWIFLWLFSDEFLCFFHRWFALHNIGIWISGIGLAWAGPQPAKRVGNDDGGIVYFS